MRLMEDVRCKCGKIVFQVNGNEIIIKCRHCKRMIVIKTTGLVSISDGNETIECKMEQSV